MCEINSHWEVIIRHLLQIRPYAIPFRNLTDPIQPADLNIIEMKQLSVHDLPEVNLQFT